MELFEIVWIGEVVLDQCIPYSSKKLSVNNRIVKVDFCLVYLFMYDNISGHSMNTNTKKMEQHTPTPPPPNTTNLYSGISG